MCELICGVHARRPSAAGALLPTLLCLHCSVLDLILI